MKIPLAPAPLLVALLLASGVTARADAPAGPADPTPVLTIVVVDSLHGGGPGMDTFERLDRVFTEVFKQQKWPLKYDTERFGAGAPDYPLELRVFYEGIHRETPVDLTFRAWIILYDHGKKHDFGIVRYDSNPRIGQMMTDQLDGAVRGAAKLIAAKIGPVLFPKPDAPKP